MAYDGVVVNDDSRDAFFSSIQNLTVTGAMERTVELRRPFAQINVGTSDLEDAAKVGVTLATTAVTVDGAYTKLNLLSGLASDPVSVSFAAGAPADAEEFPYEPDTYSYLAMVYVLTGTELLADDVQKAQSELMNVSVDLTMADGHAVNIPVDNAPVQRNYRTNIYGALLTSPLDFTIIIEPQPEGDHNQPLEVSEPATDKNGVYLITTPEELAYVAEHPTIWKGKTLRLMNDIDLQGMIWHPIGYNRNRDTNQGDMDYFEGTFDGNHKTVSNFMSVETGNFAVAGLFGAVRGTIKNLYVNNADVRSEHYAGGLVAYCHNNNQSTYNGVDNPVDGYLIQGCRVNNSHIVTTSAKQPDGTYDNGDKAGALIGYVNAIALIDNCDVRNNVIEGYRDLGGLVGYVGGVADKITITIKGSYSISNTIKQHYANGNKTVTEVYKRIGEVYGWRDIEPVIEGGGHHSNKFYIYDMAPTTADELATALRYAADGTTITLGEYTYEAYEGNTTFAQSGKNFTVKGAGKGKTIVNMTGYALIDANVVIEDMTVKLPTAAYNGFSNYRSGEFNNVDFEGCLWSWGREKVVYNNCTFDGSAADIYPLWIKYTADATLNNCTVIAKNGRGILINGDTDFNRIPVHNVTLNDCVFEVKENAKDKAVFQIHTENDAADITGTIRLNNVKFPADKYLGGLWCEINNSTEQPTQIFNIWVDGKQVQTGR